MIHSYAGADSFKYPSCQIFNFIALQNQMYFSCQVVLGNKRSPGGGCVRKYYPQWSSTPLVGVCFRNGYSNGTRYHRGTPETNVPGASVPRV